MTSRHWIERARQRARAVTQSGLALLSVGLGCDSSVLLGSQCKDGVCPFAEGADACVVRTFERQVTVTREPGSGEFLGLCLPEPQRRDEQGLAPIHVYWELTTSSSLRSCEQQSFLHPVPDDIAKRHGLRGDVICEVDQLPVVIVPNAKEPPLVPSGSGFFYDDFSDTLGTMCARSQPYRVGFLGDALPMDGITVHIDAQELLTSRGEATSDAVCSPASDPAHVGDRCVPSLQDYDDSEAVVSTRTAACGGGACLAFHLRGSLATDCASQSLGCISEESLSERALCTCRCDAPEPDNTLCDCPSDLVCLPIIPDGPLAGSYCVPRRIVTAE